MVLSSADQHVDDTFVIQPHSIHFMKINAVIMSIGSLQSYIEVCTPIVVKAAFKPSSTLRHPIDMSRVKKRVTEEKKRVENYQDLESTDRLYNKVMVSIAIYKSDV